MHSTSFGAIAQQGYVVGNLRAGYRTGPFTFTAFVENIANSRYFLFSINDSFASPDAGSGFLTGAPPELAFSPGGSVGQRRMFGVSVRASL